MSSLFLEVINHMDLLSDVLIHGEPIMALLVSNFYVNWINTAESTCQSLDLFWPGSRKHESLTLLTWDFFNDFDHVLFKSHI